MASNSRDRGVKAQVFPTAALGQYPPFLACFPTVPEGLRWNHIAHPAWGQCGLSAGLEGRGGRGWGRQRQGWGHWGRTGALQPGQGRRRTPGAGEGRLGLRSRASVLSPVLGPSQEAAHPASETPPSWSRAWRTSVGVLEGFLQPLWGLVVHTGCEHPVAGRPVPAHSL